MACRAHSRVDSLTVGGFGEPSLFRLILGVLVSFSHRKFTALLGVLVSGLGGLVSRAAINQWVIQDVPGDLVSKLLVRIYY